jgi:hypothetical protein
MEVLRNLLEDIDFVKAPSLFDKQAKPAADEASAADVSAAAAPAVVWARPQFRRREAEEPIIPVKLLCYGSFERGNHIAEEKKEQKKKNIIISHHHSLQSGKGIRKKVNANVLCKSIKPCVKRMNLILFSENLISC